MCLCSAAVVAVTLLVKVSRSFEKRVSIKNMLESEMYQSLDLGVGIHVMRCFLLAWTYDGS